MSAKQRVISLSAVAVTLGGFALAAGAPAVANPVSAQAAAVTIHGPATAGYGAVVTLTGTGTPANSQVLIYFHRKGSTGYVKRRTLTSDANGHYATTYVADTDYRYYAVANGTKGPSGLTQLPTASCSTSAAIPGALPFPAAQMFRGFAFASIQASDGNGRVAGFAYDGISHIALISRAGGHPFSVVARYSYPNGLEPVSAVHVDAVTRTGGVIVDVEPASDVSQGQRRVAYVYAGGHRHQLAHAADWMSVVPVGVTSAGTIVGVARTGKYSSSSARYYVITWAGAGAPYKVLVRNGAQDPFAAVAANGAIAYNPPNTSAYNVRLPSGQVVHLGTVPGNEDQGTYIAGANGSAFYGLAYTGNGSTVARWNTASVPASAPIPATLMSPAHVLDWLVAVGKRGDVVTLRGYQQTFPKETNRYLRTAPGALVKMPASYTDSAGSVVGVTVDGDGSVVFTGSSDHLPHILHCH